MADSGDGGTPPQQLAQQVRAEQRRRWRQGERPLVEEFLGAQPPLQAEREAVLELIYNEVVLREERREGPLLDEYLQRFPQLAEELRRQFEVHAAIQADLSTGAAEQAPADRPVDSPTLRLEGAPRMPRPHRLSVPGYDILRELGRGGMGVVYLAQQVRPPRQVALKMILAGRHGGPEAVARFLREAEAVARVQHPNIVQIYEVGETDGLPFLALEYVGGGSLEAKLAGKPLPHRAAAQLVRTLAQAMHHAHQQGVIHRDLKPANILLTGDGTATAASDRSGWGSQAAITTATPKITDFGLAKFLVADAQGLTRTHEVLGTPSYMAPELAAGKAKAIGPVVDVYALGAILYETLTGRPPFLADTPWATVLQVQHEEPVSPSPLQSGTPRDLVTICLKCLHKDPLKRYASAAALADDLGRFLEGKPILARPAGVAERAVKWAKRRPAVAALLAGMVVVTVLGFAGITWQWLRADAEKAEAKKAQERAEGEEAKAKQARDEAETRLHFNRLALAQHELTAFNAGQAGEILDQCPADRRQWEWHYLFRQCHRDLLRLTGPTWSIHRLAFSPDGRWLAAASGEWNGKQPGEVRVWDTRGSGPASVYSGHPGPVYAVAFHPDGRRLASGGSDGTVHVWEPGRAAGAQLLGGHTGPVYHVACSPDGRLLASAGADGSVRLWDAATGQVRHTLRGHRKNVFMVKFSPDGRQLASGSRDGTARLWDVDTGKELCRLQSSDDVRAVAFHPDGRWLVTANWDGSVKLFNLTHPDAEPISHPLRAGAVSDVVFSPDGQTLAWCSHAGNVQLSDVRSGATRLTFRGHNGRANSLAFSPDGRRLVSAGTTDRTAIVWDATAEQEPRVVAHSSWVVGLAFSPDGRRLALAGGENRSWGGRTDQTVRLWDLVRWERIRDFQAEAAAWLTCVAFHPNGRQLAAGSDNQTATIWDADSGQIRHTLPGHRGSVTGVAYRPDGGLLATASTDRTVKLWDAATGREVCTLAGHDGAVTSLAFSPDGGLLATAGADRTVRLWNAAKGSVVRTLIGHAAVVNSVAFSPDGRYLASASVDQVLKFWDVATGQEVLPAGRRIPVGYALEDPALVLRAVRDPFLPRLAFCPQGLRLASVGRNRPVEIWEVPTGQVALALHGQGQTYLDLAFSPTGRHLAASTGPDVVVWDATDPRQEAPADPRVWHRREAARAWAAKNWFAVRFHANPLLDADADERDVRAWRGDAHAELGQWNEAVADFAGASQRLPDELVLGVRHAQARLGAGKPHGYRTVCAALLERFGRTTDPQTANSVAWVCVLAPNAVAEPARTVQLAERAVASKPDGPLAYFARNTLGAALYRAGRYDAAVQKLNEAIQLHGKGGTSDDWLFLAMAHHRLGHADEARRYLAQAVQWLEPADPREAAARAQQSWSQRLEGRLLRAEAEALLRNGPNNSK